MLRFVLSSAYRCSRLKRKGVAPPFRETTRNPVRNVSFGPYVVVCQVGIPQDVGRPEVSRVTTAWQRRIDRPDRPAVPIFVKRMHRTFWCPPGYERVVRFVSTHPEFSQREAARACAMTLAGVERALKRLAGWGVLVVTATRGRFGRTRARVQTDVRTANVSPTGERLFLRPTLRVAQTVDVVDTLAVGLGLTAWRALRGVFGAAR